MNGGYILNCTSEVTQACCVYLCLKLLVRKELRLSEDLRHRTWGFSYCFGRCGLRGGRTEADVSWRTYFLSDTPVSSGISHCQWPLSQERGARESYSRSQAADKSGREEWQRRCLPRVRRRRAGGATTHCDIDDVCLRLNSKHTTATASERSRATLLKCAAACSCFTARFRTHIQVLFKSIQFSSVLLHFYWVFSLQLTLASHLDYLYLFSVCLLFHPNWT